MLIPCSSSSKRDSPSTNGPPGGIAVRIDILTLFPEMFAGPFDASIVRRASDNGIVQLGIHNLRDWTHDRHRTADDTPYGGGPGMIMKAEPIFDAVDEIGSEGAEIVLLSPNGELLKQRVVEELAGASHLILICGHYEGIDERVADGLATRIISIGDYVLSGGEIPSMVLVDAVVRILPGAVGCADSCREEAFSDGLLEYPQYTRPRDYRGLSVPDVLLSGNHQEVARWKRRESLRRTLERRPDLLTPEHWREIERERLQPPTESD